MSAHAEVLKIERHGAIALLTLNRPESLNAFDAAMRTAVLEALPRLDADADVGAIVITGAGPRAFCAGQDLAESRHMDWVGQLDRLNRQQDVYRAVRNLDKPCVVALNGTAVGAGFQIALLADLRIGHPGSRMGQPEVKAGIASIVGSYLMSLQVGLSLNQQLSLTGELITGERAHQLGLINELVSQDKVVETALARAQTLSNLPPTAFRATKRQFRELTQAGFEQACSTGIRYQLECQASGEPQRVAKEFFARRAPTP